MLKVSVVDIAGQRRYDVQCPKCKYVMMFFMACPTCCTECGTKIPNAIGILRYNDERGMYHKKGKTSDGSRTV